MINQKTMEDILILVDENDNEIGLLDKLSVHQQGLLHRAFSVFVFNSNDELLLQKRAEDKYHSGGLWSNTCCSHPRSGETTLFAVNRRLKEEMGIECAPEFKFSFIYKTNFENGLTEYEYDHVYVGESDQIPSPDENEVQDWKYISLENLQHEIKKNPENFSEWLKICLPEIIKYVNEDTDLSLKKELVSSKINF